MLPHLHVDADLQDSQFERGSAQRTLLEDDKLLNQDKLEAARLWLVRRRQQLAAGVEHSFDELHLDGHHLADLDEMASDVDSDSSVFEHFRSSSEVLEQIDLALRRIDEGTYLSCDGCGEDIPSERLDALPFATQCIVCKEKDERWSG